MSLEETAAIYATIRGEKKAPALLALQQALAPAKEQIVAAIRANRRGWFAPYHFDWGMQTRNFLRRQGFGEEYFGVANLDDIYVELVEEALGER